MDAIIGLVIILGLTFTVGGAFAFGRWAPGWWAWAYCIILSIILFPGGLLTIAAYLIGKSEWLSKKVDDSRIKRERNAARRVAEREILDDAIDKRLDAANDDLRDAIEKRLDKRG